MDSSTHRFRSTVYFGALVSILAFAIMVPWFIDPSEYIATGRSGMAAGLSEEVAAFPLPDARPRPSIAPC